MIQKLKVFALLPMLVAGLALFTVSAMPSPVGAQCAQGDTGPNCIKKAIGSANGGTQMIGLNAGFGFSTLGQALNTIISIIFLVAGLAAFVYILLGAFNYLTAGDDASKTEKARKMITNAVVGLILVALVYVIWLVAINLVPGLSQFFSADAGTT
jgi:hypothetical protein